MTSLEPYKRWLRPANFACAFIAGFLASEYADAAREIQLGLGLFTCIAWLWISEAVHVSITALLVPLLASALGLVDVEGALVKFADPVIFLFMGGFALAAALQKYELDRAFAVRLLAWSGGRPLYAVLLLFVATASLSMWISNTATVALMLPLALGLLSSRNPDLEPRLYLFVLLGVAYSGNLGGMATLIGSPPNAIAASAMDLNFRAWLGFGGPAFLLLFPLMICLLFINLRPSFGASLELEAHAPPVDAHRRLVPFIFSATALGWIFSAPLSSFFGIDAGFDALIALAAIVVLVSTGSLSFLDFVTRTNWGVLLLFGGGLTLSAVLQETGTSEWLAQQLVAVLSVESRWLILVAICLFTVFLSELVSNTASAALLVPLFTSVAAGFGLPQIHMAAMVALAASCACMLPVATPPNALVFSSGLVPQRQMMRVGITLNPVFALVLATLFWLRGF